MTPARPALLVLLACVVQLACAGARSNADGTGDAAVTEEEAGLFAQAALPADSAVVIAKAAVAGQVVKAVLEREDGTLLYSFDVKVPGKSGITEVHVDGQSGAVLKIEEE